VEAEASASTEAAGAASGRPHSGGGAPGGSSGCRCCASSAPRYRLHSSVDRVEPCAAATLPMSLRAVCLAPWVCQCSAPCVRSEPCPEHCAGKVTYCTPNKWPAKHDAATTSASVTPPRGGARLRDAARLHVPAVAEPEQVVPQVLPQQRDDLAARHARARPAPGEHVARGAARERARARREGIRSRLPGARLGRERADARARHAAERHEYLPARDGTGSEQSSSEAPAACRHVHARRPLGALRQDSAGLRRDGRA